MPSHHHRLPSSIPDLTSSLYRINNRRQPQPQPQPPFKTQSLLLHAPSIAISIGCSVPSSLTTTATFSRPTTNPVNLPRRTYLDPQPSRLAVRSRLTPSLSQIYNITDDHRSSPSVSIRPSAQQQPTSPTPSSLCSAVSSSSVVLLSSRSNIHCRQISHLSDITIVAVSLIPILSIFIPFFSPPTHRQDSHCSRPFLSAFTHLTNSAIYPVATATLPNRPVPPSFILIQSIISPKIHRPTPTSISLVFVPNLS